MGSRDQNYFYESLKGPTRYIRQGTLSSRTKSGKVSKWAALFKRLKLRLTLNCSLHEEAPHPMTKDFYFLVSINLVIKFKPPLKKISGKKELHIN